MVLDRFKKWFSVLKPEGLDSFIAETSGKENLMDALTNFVIIAVIGTVFFGIVMAVYLLLVGALLESLISKLNIATMFGSLAVFGVLALATVFVGSIVMQFISSGITWVLAKLFGGKATYTRQTHALSYLSGGFQLTSIALMFVAWIPCLGGAVSTAYLIYHLYMNYRLVKSVHQLDQMRAIAVVLIPVILVLILVAAFYLFYFAALLMTPRPSYYY